MSSTTSTRAFNSFKQFVYVFAATVAIQTFHIVEHVAQVMQKFVFDVAPAHGLVGQLDVEQVHFAFNVFYLGLLIYLTLGWLNLGGQISRKQKLIAVVLMVTTLVQTYHVVEHVVKLAQFIGTGMQGTPGIAGMHFDGVIFHALMNVVVFAPVAVVFFSTGLHRELFQRRG